MSGDPVAGSAIAGPVATFDLNTTSTFRSPSILYPWILEREFRLGWIVSGVDEAGPRYWLVDGRVAKRS